MEMFRGNSGNKERRNSGGRDLFLENYSQLFCLSEKLHTGRGNDVFTVRTKIKVVQSEKKLIVNLNIIFKWVNIEGNFPKYVVCP